MKNCVFLAVAFLMLANVVQASEPSAEFQRNWPQWRGPHATGVAPHANPPLEWSADKNMRWKIEIPGQGHASPVIWGDQIFILTAVETEEAGASSSAQEAPAEGRRGRGVSNDKIHQFNILSVSRKDGKTLWQKTAIEALPHEGTHNDGSWASNSPVTDGEVLVASFGSRGIFCYDLKGNLKWQTDLGDMSTRNGFGEGSSPALYGDKLVVNWDHEGPSFIVVFDKKTGKEMWKLDRDEPTSWSTPLVINHNGTPQVIVNATNRVRSYDLNTGKILWESSGMTVNAIPSPVHEDGMVYVMSGFRGSALQAIRLAEASGHINDTPAIVWQHGSDTPYVPSPLLYDDHLYFLKVNTAILSSFNASSGKPNYEPQRLEGLTNIYASPVGAAGRVYITSRNGATLVLKNGPQFEILATNQLDDDFEASAAVVDQELYLRGKQTLYCIAEN
jgi:outer membrane protein assembly factor BamB